MPSPWIERGDPRSPFWVVGEAPGEAEIAQGRPFVGLSGMELDRMLLEAGWNPADLFYTNVAHERPPSYKHPRTGQWIHNDIDQFFPGVTQARRDGVLPFGGRFPREPVIRGLERLSKLLTAQSPRLVIALGGTPLWGLTQREGITKWRGSILQADTGGKVLPTFHPADILRQWPHRVVAVQDLRRAKRESAFPEIRTTQWDFTVEPTLSQVRSWLHPFLEHPSPLVCDTEGWGVVDAIGFASSATRALCVPFVREEGDEVRSYWSASEEVEVFDLLHRVIVTCPITFHNAIWDLQVIGKNWGYLPCLSDDTMVAQHVRFPGLLGGKIDPITGKVDKKGSSLSLSFIASMYCDQYVYWKDDGRVRDDTYTDQQYWHYNCEDCARTWECREALHSGLRQAGLWDQYQHEMRLFGPVIQMMFRGIRLDKGRARELRDRLHKERAQEQDWLDAALGFKLNVGSWPQMQALFYDDLKVRPVLHRVTHKPTLDDNALELIARREPLLVPLIRKIQNLRSIGTNYANFIAPAIGTPGDRLRTCLNIAGTETFRFSSNETAFGEGLNMQNLTRPSDD